MDDTERAEFLQALRLAVPKEDLLVNVPMSGFTSLKIGGPAEFLVEISDDEQAAEVLKAAALHGVPVHVIGNGSNLLVRDGGLKGLTLRFAEKYSDISSPASHDGSVYTITAQSGATMTALANAAADAGLTGLEFAAGIPGTVGGGVRMNAGAYGGEIGDVTISVACLTRQGRNAAVQPRGNALCLPKQPLDGRVVLYVTVMLKKSREDTVRVAMRELNARRRDKQPPHHALLRLDLQAPAGAVCGRADRKLRAEGLSHRRRVR